MISILFLLLSVSCEEENRIGDNTIEAKTPGTAYFYKGGTMCFASYLQDIGLVYRENNRQTDPYLSMKNHGANCIRLQLDHVPFSKKGDTKIDWQTFERVLEDAKKVKACGMELFLTLKPDYDIYNPTGSNHNNMPPAWTGKSEAETAQALYKWVYDTLERLAEEDIFPAIVAVGNEVNLGFLKEQGISEADNLRTGALLAQGFKAVFDYAEKYNPACLKALHLADPEKARYALETYEKISDLNYDVVAISYYPGKDIGHTLPAGNFKDFSTMLGDRRFMVLETAHSFTTGIIDGEWKGDMCNNAYNYPDWDEDANAENYTPAKARKWLKELALDIKAAGGLGLITWGTESLPDLAEGQEKGHGLGLYTYPADWAYGSTWENNSYWDFTDNNNLHEAVDWMMDID